MHNLASKSKGRGRIGKMKPLFSIGCRQQCKWLELGCALTLVVLCIAQETLHLLGFLASVLLVIEKNLSICRFIIILNISGLQFASLLLALNLRLSSLHILLTGLENEGVVLPKQELNFYLWKQTNYACFCYIVGWLVIDIFSFLYFVVFQHRTVSE